MRRLRIPRDLVNQSIHYLEQYYSMMIVWSIKTVEQMPQGLEREKFRQGVQALMNEIESNFCRMRDIAGDSPQTIQEAMAQLQTPEYQKLMDKAKVQHYAHVIKNVGRISSWKHGLLNVADFVISWVLRSILFVGFHSKGHQNAK